MVQILKPQMRNYQADQTAAIKQQQTTQFISDVGGVVQGVANIYNAYQKGAEADKKKAEQADQDIINTEIGEQANIKAGIEAEKALGSLNPSSEAGMSAINEAFSKVFSGYEGQMGSERGKIALQTMQRKGADAFIKSAIKEYGSESQVKARQAAANIQNATMFDAKNFGVSGDIKSFREKSDSAIETLSSFAESNGLDKQEVASQLQAQHGYAYASGLAESSPLEMASIIGLDEDENTRNATIKSLMAQHPNLSKREAGAIFDNAVQKKEGWKNEQIKQIFGTDGVEYIRAQRVAELEKARDAHSPKTPAYRQAQEKLDSIKGDGIYDYIREDLKKSFGVEIGRSVEKQILAQRQQEYEENVSVLQDCLSPDPLVASKAKRAVFGRQFEGEISDSAVQKILGEYEKNHGEIKKDMYPTYKGTQSIQSKIIELAKDKTSTPAQFALKAAETMNYIHGLEITDEQEEEAQDMVYSIMKDRVGGDLIAKTLDNANKYYPELNWFERYLTGSVASQEDSSIVQQGVELITGSKAPDVVENRGSLRQNRSSKAQAEAVLQAELLELNKTATSMANEALMLQGNERAQAMKNIEEYIIKGKQDIFDNKLADYGINMPPLREKLKMGQPVYLQIGAKTKQYLGDNPDGTPKFVDYVNPTIDKKQKTLLERLTGIGERVSEVVKSRKGE